VRTIYNSYNLVYPRYRMFKCLFLYIFHNGNEKRSLKKKSKYVVNQIIQTCDKRKTTQIHELNLQIMDEDKLQLVGRGSRYT